MKKTTPFYSACLVAATLITAIPCTTSQASTKSTLPSMEVIKNTFEEVTPYYLYIQELKLSFTPGASKIPYTISLEGTSKFKSISGTATLYKQNSAGTYEKKEANTHTLSGKSFIKTFSFSSYGTGNYKIIFKGTAYSTTGGQESFTITETNSY